MSEPNPPAVIRLRGVRNNNLKNFDLDLPLHRLIVVTGLSGSGKSSLAFDTLYAEGQRRYVETFSPYARQFFDRMDKPQVESVEGIPPAIAIEQRNAVRTTRSTVGTMTEICDYMKVLWPHVAQLHCRGCGQPVRKDSPQEIWRRMKDECRTTNGEVLVTFDLRLSEKLSLDESLALISKQGYQRLLQGDEVVRLDEAVSRITHHAPRIASLTVLQDRVRLTSAHRARFIEACEQAYHFGKGKLAIHELVASVPHSTLRAPRLFSNRRHCAKCDIEYRDPTPALFSFNHPLGACPACKGFGRIITIDYDLAIPDRSLNLAQGAVRPWRSGFSAECQEDLKKFCKIRRVPMDVPFNELSHAHQHWVLDGDEDYGIDVEHRWPRLWYGVRGYFRWLESKSYKMHVRVLLSRYRAYTKCPECEGARFNNDALLYLLSVAAEGRGLELKFPAVGESLKKSEPPALGGDEKLTLADFYALPVRDGLRLVEHLTANQSAISNRQSAIEIVSQEVRARLAYLNEVGLGYLTLDRPTRTLSGGETERVNLTTCLGTRLVNTLFVLDEPSVGLHPRDTERLVRILEKLRDTGNTVVVVEHEASVMRAADQIIDLGPGQGATGGEVVFQGTLAELVKSERSLTGQYLSGARRIEVPERRPVEQASSLSPSDSGKRRNGDRQVACPTLRIANATQHNLRNVTVEIPLNRFVCVTGVSGSGKSTLIRELLYPAVMEQLKSPISDDSQSLKASDRINDDKDEGSDSSRNAQHATRISGHEHFGRVVLVDQSALGKTPRSNPAVYIGAFDDIREVFAQSEAAKQRGLKASAFSFNSAEGQCERCRGVGFEKIEMQFLSDVFIRCPDCNGHRYRQHILEVKIRNPNSEIRREWSIADTLDVTVDEVIELFGSFAESKPARGAVASLKLLQEVGLGYLRLGQPINTLSGGESQRLKLVAHLAEATQHSVVADISPLKSSSVLSQSRLTPDATLFLFDEPTTGLHFDDVRVLLQVFQKLVDAGNSVVVIEHNLDVIKCADWLIDLGPEAGDEGGHIVAQGTPEDVARCELSHTGRFLRGLVGTRSPASQITLKKVRDAVGRVPTNGDHAISIHGAREHNLKNLSLDIPRDRFVVVTGVSGSGKSTLAFDLLFAEGQRRFLDSMNLYARQFVEQMTRPDVDLITGIPPTVSIEQRTSRGGGKSTVATVTEVFHFLRLLFTKLGTQYCPDCQVPVEPQTRDEVGRQLQIEVKRRGDLFLLAPIVKGRKGFHSDVADWAAKHGYKEIRADGKIYHTSEPFRLDRFREHNVEIVVGVLEKGKVGALRRPDVAARRPYQQLIDEVLRLGNGTLFALDNYKRLTAHSTERVCPKCNRSFEPLDPKNFSYNSPSGWCPKCRGFGELFYLPDVERGANADSIEESWWSWANEREVCPDCKGSRLNPVARAVHLKVETSRCDVRSAQRAAPTIDDFSSLDVKAAFEVFRRIKFTGRSATIARDILPEIRERLKFLNEVGLGYLQLGRSVPTLSGGEAQRIRLAAQLGSNLSGVLYVLDEPTIGLHARDNEQLLVALDKLKARGNSVIVVEHDEATMRRADHIVDLGPGAGVHGGEVVAAGTLKELAKHPESVTGQCLRAEKRFPARGERRRISVPAGASRLKLKSRKSQSRLTSAAANNWLTLNDATANNLKNLTVHFPLGRLVLVTGVSGSGKSTLIHECLLPALQSVLSAERGATRAGSPSSQNGLRGRSPHLTGYESIKAVYEVDQSPIGRTPRSIPATYVGFFDDVRQLFAQVPEARIRGYTASRFSFNSAQGRCPECEGAGQIKLEMNFLPPAFVRCETCNGTRFNRETLDIEYAGKNIAQVLELSVEEALEFFSSLPNIKRALEALHDTGLDYLKLGQQSPTLSGGEAQRVKLVSHLLSGLKPQLELPTITSAKAAKRNLFILEEPTIGLHMADVKRLVEVSQRLVDAGHSVIVIEHNLDLIAEADWVIDLGPEGGAGGGRIVGEGTPEQIARNRHSHTGRFLRNLLRG